MVKILGPLNVFSLCRVSFLNTESSYWLSSNNSIQPTEEIGHRQPRPQSKVDDCSSYLGMHRVSRWGQPTRPSNSENESCQLSAWVSVMGGWWMWGRTGCSNRVSATACLSVQLVNKVSTAIMKRLPNKIVIARPAWLNGEKGWGDHPQTY